MNDKLKIGLTFSGGGYRAATFHLGTLSYLHSVKLGNSTLLEHVIALSTISGGSITGLRYMLGLSRGESAHEVYRELYAFFTNVELATIAMNNLALHDKKQCASLIRTMANIYDDKLFKGAVLGDLMDAHDKMHIKHFSANATDFTNALPFRFQVTEKVETTEQVKTGYGIIGNKNLQIPRDIARHIHLSDALACSSCFPSGFEPLIFPDDFALGDLKKVKDFQSEISSFGIMDGGIVDNQGIEPILLAEQRMKKRMDRPDGNCIDLIIVSDVASPYMDAYKPSNIHLPMGLNKMSLKKLSRLLWGTGIVATGVVATSFALTSTSFLSGILLTIWALVALILTVYFTLKKKLIAMAKQSVVKDGIPSVMKLHFGDIATLVANRISSVLMLTTTVFMKHIRRLDYRSIYNDDSWTNRSIMNGVYELRPQEKWEKKELPDYLKPSEKIQENSIKASAMGTTLWFTKEDKEAGMPEALIAAGQYTICWNLLEYIEKIKMDKTNINEHHQLILNCENQLREDWEKFQKEPQYKIKEWK